MVKRIVFGSMMIAALAAVLWADWWLDETDSAQLPPYQEVRAIPLALVVVVLVVSAFTELSRLARAAGVRLLHKSGLPAALALALLPFWAQVADAFRPDFQPIWLPGTLVVLSVAMMAVFAEQMIRGRTADALGRVAFTMLAVVYLGAGGAIVLWLRLLYGVPVLVMFLTAVKVTDIGAYFVGSAVGRHKLIPWLSPGKSWEGLVGGLAAGAGASVLCAWLMNVTGLSLVQAGVFGVVVGLAGQFADLCESLLKRSVSVKDAGSAVPEFGGVLDILDSPLLAAPVAAMAMMVIQYFPPEIAVWP